MKKILQKTDTVLRKKAKEVPLVDIKKVKIKKILKEMAEALRSQNDGVAIAAPQIGYTLRIFLVAGKIFEKSFVENKTKNSEEKLLNQNNVITESETKKTDEKIKPARPVGGDLVFINPKISKLSKEKEWVPEGCLSVRPLYGKTFRSKKATVTAHDEHGKKFTRGASGLLAQIFQHETDHLDGILFIDHAIEIREETLPIKK